VIGSKPFVRLELKDNLVIDNDVCKEVSNVGIIVIDLESLLFNAGNTGLVEFENQSMFIAMLR